VGELSETTRLDLTVYPFDGQGLPADLQAVRNMSGPEYPNLTMPLNDDYIGGYRVIDDVFGKPALIMKVMTPRLIYQNGKDTIAYIILSTLAVGMVIAALAIVLLEKVVLSRLSYLDRAVTKISASNDLSARVVVAGKDELSNLSKAINNMLSSLDQSNHKLHESEGRYHAIVEDQSELICRFARTVAGFANEATAGTSMRRQVSAEKALSVAAPVTMQGAKELYVAERERPSGYECVFKIGGKRSGCSGTFVPYSTVRTGRRVQAVGDVSTGLNRRIRLRSRKSVTEGDTSPGQEQSADHLQHAQPLGSRSDR
jgi:HAMP domain-containing protein